MNERHQGTYVSAWVLLWDIWDIRRSYHITRTCLLLVEGKFNHGQVIGYERMYKWLIIFFCESTPHCCANATVPAELHDVLYTISLSSNCLGIFFCEYVSYYIGITQAYLRVLDIKSVVDWRLNRNGKKKTCFEDFRCRGIRICSQIFEIPMGTLICNEESSNRRNRARLVMGLIANKINSQLELLVHMECY